MIHFVGAGPGATDLITVRGLKLLERADVIIYAGSLVNPKLLDAAKPACRIYNSARMTLEDVIGVMEDAEKRGLMTVRLHTGDPSVYGAVREQMEELEKRGIEYDVTPGVSSFCGAAASLGMEYTLPGISQSVILTRMEGRTKVPEKETIESFAAHGTTMVLFLSSGMTGELAKRLMEGGYSPKTPAAIVYKATWPEEQCLTCTVETLESTAAENGINRTALIIVGEAVRYNRLSGRRNARENGKPIKSGNPEEATHGFEKSRLYDAGFTTGYREAGNGKKETGTSPQRRT
ncbi:MAG TPA: precorrin-4 C(11)-methyltransferase [Lachnospiraceae bacterium]|nr:precorrin-4 C(11)-methyltransferase [Lachnospiraceae bacterium]